MRERAREREKEGGRETGRMCVCERSHFILWLTICKDFMLWKKRVCARLCGCEREQERQSV